MTLHPLPAKQLTLASGESGLVVSVCDLILANYGLDRGLDDVNAAKDFAEVKAYTPAWAEQITGVPRQHIEQIAREFADTAHKTHGRSMIILGAGVNHWYHMDMNYRGMINLLVFCGCVGQSGGGWSHYVGQEKLRPQTGWLPLAFALDWSRPPRQMNSTFLFLQPRQPVALRKTDRAGAACRRWPTPANLAAALSTSTSVRNGWAGYPLRPSSTSTR
ncbi:molybdopterin-dependent oxidoreductase [Klebsiella pneumoniae subsp. pneumoniae]|nr:molybdopterin-dependent oxidoreductase [Klebsiella pneumoniae subsp. pneumoniae]